MADRTHAPGSRALRRGRISLAGQIYVLTTVAAGRRPFFRDWAMAARMCAALAERRLWRGSNLLCWVLMPDHLHLLVALGDDETVAKLMQRVKAVTAKACRIDPTPGTTRVWMPGYHDRALRRDEDVRAVARYIVLNPVRAGLVARIAKYPFWDAVWL